MTAGLGTSLTSLDEDVKEKAERNQNEEKRAQPMILAGKFKI